MELKEGNGKNDKGKLKNQVLHIHMIMQIGLDKEFVLQAKEDV